MENGKWRMAVQILTDLFDFNGEYIVVRLLVGFE